MTLDSENTNNELFAGQESELREELRRFFSIAAAEAAAGTYHCDISMPACLVDEYWHELCDSGEADELSVEASGMTFDHINDYELFPESRGEGSLPWLARYEEMFGPLSKVWFTDQEGNFDEATYKQYLEDSSYKASWGCNPGLKQKPVKFSWNCNPGVKQKPVKFSWNCNPGAKQIPVKFSWQCNPGMKTSQESVESSLIAHTKEEFRKFLLACEVARDFGVDGSALGMPQGIVDCFWTDFSQDEEYSNFCRHLTNTEVRRQEAEEVQQLNAGWLPYYERMFGTLHDVWFVDERGELDFEAREAYLESKELLRVQSSSCNLI